MLIAEVIFSACHPAFAFCTPLTWLSPLLPSPPGKVFPRAAAARLATLLPAPGPAASSLRLLHSNTGSKFGAFFSLPCVCVCRQLIQGFVDQRDWSYQKKNHGRPERERGLVVGQRTLNHYSPFIPSIDRAAGRVEKRPGKVVRRWVCLSTCDKFLVTSEHFQ